MGYYYGTQKFEEARHYGFLSKERGLLKLSHLPLTTESTPGKTNYLRVPIISAWSSRGLLGSSILCSSEWSELYPCRGQPISSVRMPSLQSFILESDPTICLKLKLTSIVPNCHISPNARKLGFVIITQGQTGCKLCVKHLNLHGYELHVREDSPALLRFDTQLLRSPVEAPSRDMRFGLKMLKDFSLITLPLMLARHPSNVTLVEHSFQSSIASPARAIYDHLLVKDFAKPVLMVESTLVLIDSSYIVKLPRVENSF
ncbi:PREDICTED: uncharacterized protein LOC104740935 isoform X2 [Camelina sativa]|uniref:Uncharacterized protein LOC104740935 isoform X2 n=1 Tax=Camelina sativa TaxID=90675 RepID=A0ABM0VR95_CAMSA|nr:PREDICTED: uncharacterized protein LOC104740935 isoform X2 [Camelina sativa]